MDAIATDDGEMAAWVRANGTWQVSEREMAKVPRGKRRGQARAVEWRSSSVVRTYGECASQGEVGAAGQLLVLVIPENGTKRPVGRDSLGMHPQPVHGCPHDGNRPADAHAVVVRVAIEQQQALNEWHEQAGKMETLALDFAYGTRYLIQRDSARTQHILAAGIRQTFELDDEEKGHERERQDVLEKVLIPWPLMGWEYGLLLGSFRRRRDPLEAPDDGSNAGQRGHGRA